jgi:TatD DNase family protein
MLVDSHCHLDFPDFAEDLEGTVARARAAGVGRMLSINTRLSHFDGVLAVAERFDDIYCTVGIHPHEAHAQGSIDAERLIALAQHPKVVGFGETGLDYYYEHSPRDEQIASFLSHIVASRELNLPIIVHTRDADAETGQILAEEYAKQPYTGLIHCFSSGRELAEKALELGLYISLSGILTFNKAEELRTLVRDLPMDRLLVETDAPFLAPVPKRGKTNEPAYVVHTAAKLAEIKGLSIQEVEDATTENFFRLFAKVAR